MEHMLDCRELFARLGEEEILVVDCRIEATAADVNEVQVPGALRMSFNDLSRACHILPDDELIVLCGAAVDHSDARRAYRLLRMRGRNAAILQGGIREWIGRGYLTERVDATRSSLHQEEELPWAIVSDR